MATPYYQGEMIDFPETCAYFNQTYQKLTMSKENLRFFKMKAYLFSIGRLKRLFNSVPLYMF